MEEGKLVELENTVNYIDIDEHWLKIMLEHRVGIVHFLLMISCHAMAIQYLFHAHSLLLPSVVRKTDQMKIL